MKRIAVHATGALTVVVAVIAMFAASLTAPPVPAAVAQPPPPPPRKPAGPEHRNAGRGHRYLERRGRRQSLPGRLAEPQ